MNMLSKLLPRKFSPIESLVLDEVARMLGSPWKELYDKQIGRINKVQRHTGNKEVNLYCLKFGKVVPLPESDMFPNKTNEFPLANVSIVDSESNKIEAVVWIVNGRVFSINFDKSPDNLTKDFSVCNAGLLTDLRSGQSSTEYLANFVLPSDYLEMVQTSDAVINDWRVFALLNTRIVAMSDCNLCIIAEKSETAYIGVRSNDKSGELILFDFGTGKQTCIGTALLPGLVN